MFYAPLASDVEAVARQCIDVGIQIHRILGQGFKEIIYERAFCLELNSRGISYESEKPILVRYKSWDIPGHKIDVIVDRKVLVELKAVPKLRSLHHQQVISYLRATGLRLGLLMNFNGSTLKAGLRRIVL